MTDVVAAAAAKSQATNSRTVADTITGEHEHTICGYSLLKGIGDGEPVASDRFSVGGHDWVLLFYPDGKKSSHADHGQVYPRADVPNLQYLGRRDGDGNAQNQQGDGRADEQRGNAGAQPAAIEAPPAGGDGAAEPRPAQPAGEHVAAANNHAAPAEQPPPQDPAVAAVQAAANAAAAAGVFAPAPPLNFHVHVPAAQPAGMAAAQLAHQNRQNRRQNEANEYCALFVALIGEGKEPQGVINTSDGKVVRAFHRFTLVDQKSGRDIMKGRQRHDGAVKISCARQDPNARNCHGYRKFVKKAVLEDPARGFLLEDRIVIKYTIELVVSQGGALTAKGPAQQNKIEVPPPTIGMDFSVLLHDEDTCDMTIHLLNDEGGSGDADAGGAPRARTVCKAHKLVLKARSSVFRSMLGAGMQEGETGVITISDMQPNVFEALLHFVYTDELPDDLQEGKMTITMAQHLLMASDRYQLERLRAICEKRLVDTVEVETVSTTLMLADKCNAVNLRQVCLSYVATNLSQVINTVEYKRLTESCANMVQEILSAVAKQGDKSVARSNATAQRPAVVSAVRRVTRQQQRREDE